jgi:ubiquinone/menaquinone biosynthesis C-methylase UbiE
MEGEEERFDYEGHIWGSAESVISLKNKRSPALNLKRFLEIIEKINGRLLEIGCGTGMFIKSVKHYRPDLEIYGCDISKTAITLAEKNKKYDIHCKIGGASALPYEDESFDIVAMMDVLEHLEDVGGAIKEAKRVLKEGGIFHLLVPCEVNKFTLHWLMWKLKIGHNLKRKYAGHIQRLTRQNIHDFIKEARLKIIKETFSFHLIGQIYDIFFDYLPRKFQRKKTIGCKRKEVFSVRDKILRSLEERGIFLTLWVILGRLVETAAFYESEILKDCPLAMGIHLTCRKESRVENRD